MPSTEKEIWDYFRTGSENESQIDFLAFGSYSFDKFEWMDKFEELNGRIPTSEETCIWISQLPNSRLDEMREWAETFFDDAARAYLDDEQKTAVREATEGALVASVRSGINVVANEVRISNSTLATNLNKAVSFRSTFWPNVVVGLASSLIFSVLIIIASVIFTRDPSPIALAKRIPGLAAPEQGH